METCKKEGHVAELSVHQQVYREAQAHLDKVCDLIGSLYQFISLKLSILMPGIGHIESFLVDQTISSHGSKQETVTREVVVRIPLIVEGKTCGVLSGARHGDDDLDIRSKMMIETVLENAYLFLVAKSESKQGELAVSRLDELSELSVDLMRQVDLKTVISTVLNAVIVRFDALGASVWLYDEKNHMMELTYQTDDAESNFIGWKLPIENMGSNSEKLLSGESFITEDYYGWLNSNKEYYLSSVPRYSDDPERILSFFAEVGGAQLSLLGIPLQSDNRLIGSLIFRFTDVPEDFRKLDSGFLILVGKLIGMALAKTSYIESEMNRKTELEATLELQNLELKKATERMRQAMEAAVKIQEHERERLSWDLHDNSNQIIAGISMHLAALKKSLFPNMTTQAEREIISIQELLKDLSGINKEMIETLNPLVLKREGLSVALPKLFDNMFRTTDIVWAFESLGESRRIGSDRELAVFRIIQEAARNALRHSGAKEVRVKIKWTRKCLSACVRDNGLGIAESHAEDGDQHYGIPTMFARAKTINARLNLDSPPDGGVCVTLNVPL
jgi:signal transduction histidine kinase